MTPSINICTKSPCSSNLKSLQKVYGRSMTGFISICDCNSSTMPNTCKFLNELIVHFHFQVLLQQRINTNKQQQPLLKSPNHIHCLHSVPHVCLSSFLFYPLFFFTLSFFPSGFCGLSCDWIFMVSRTGWCEHAIIEWLERFQIPPHMQTILSHSEASFSNLKIVSKEFTVYQWRAKKSDWQLIN